MFDEEYTPEELERVKLGRLQRQEEDKERKKRKALYAKKWREANPEKERLQCKKWRENNPERRHENSLKWNYGITREHYLVLLKEQGNKCWLCNATKPGRGHKHWCVDHDENTKKVRKLLCNRCNIGLGYFNHDPMLLHKAASYLKGGV